MEHSENEILGPAYDVRLSDLRDWHIIAVRCIKCRYQGFVWPSKLRQRWPDYTRIMDLERRFRCTACRNRHGNTWQIRRLGRG